MLCVGLVTKNAGGLDDDYSSGPVEKHLSGNKSAHDKVAVVTLDGVLMEGMLSSVHKQIEQAARDDAVKAVVFRINSPGGSITSSDDLYQRLVRLRDGDPAKKTKAKPLVASMGSVAASGGYYVAAPAASIFAERSTITGSIGVYASLPTVKKLADTYGFGLNTIKAGEIKDSGSPFRTMSPKEEQVWQDMVNDAYGQFLDVITKGRPALTRKVLLDRYNVTPLCPDPAAVGMDPARPKEYSRYRADGGIFTAPVARELGLIDTIGSLEDAVAAAAVLANLGENYEGIRYLKQKTVADLLLGTRATPPPAGLLDPDHLAAALSPRVWFLAPGYESAGLIAAGRSSR
jgi:protease-4